MSRDNQSTNHFPAVLWLVGSLLLALAGTALVLFNTRYGPGVSGDSVYYLMGALNMLAGKGFSRFSGGWEAVPITGFPPFYSTALLLPGAIFPNLADGARMLNALLMGGVTFLVSLVIVRSTPAPRLTWQGALLALLGAGFILASQAMLYYASWVMSELLFIFLMLLAFYISLHYFTSVSSPAVGRVVALAAASLLIAAAILTRYVAISAGAALGLAVLFFGRKGWKPRLFDAALVAVLCLGPFLLWLQRNARVAGTLVNREFSLHVVPLELGRALASEMISWLVPRSDALPPALRLGVFALLVLSILVLFILLERRRPAEEQAAGGSKARVITWLLAMLIPLYLVILVANSLFLDASTSLTAVRRYLLPLYVAVVLLVALLLQRSARRWSWGWLPRVGILVYVLGMLLVSVRDASAYLRQPGDTFGYTDMRRSWTQVVGTLADLDPERRLISNNVELVYVLADRPAYAFPIAYDHYVQEARADFEKQLDTARQRLADGAVIVYFGSPEAEDQEILDALNASPWRELPQATFYTLNGELQP